MRPARRRRARSPVDQAHAVADFRDASLAADITTLDLSSTFGTVELLPPWLSIDVEVASIGGAVEEPAARGQM